MPLRVVLVDDHEVVRNGIKSLLEETPDVSVVGEAGTVKDAIARVEWARPDVVIMDVRLPDGSGIEATREIRARLPKTQILMLTTFADDEALFASIMAGASGAARACSILPLPRAYWIDFERASIFSKTNGWRAFRPRKNESSR